MSLPHAFNVLRQLRKLKVLHRFESRKLHLSLAGRFALVFALLAMFAAGLTGYFAYRDGREALIDTAIEQLSTATHVLGGRIVMTLDSVERDLQLLARHPDIGEALSGDELRKESANQLFAALLTSRPAYHQIRLISAQTGKEMVRVDRRSNGAFVVSGDGLQEKATYPYVFETLALPPGGVFASPAGIHAEKSEMTGDSEREVRPTAHLAMQVGEWGLGFGRPLGVLVINLDLEGMYRHMATDLPADCAVYLANWRGDFLIHPDPAVALELAKNNSEKTKRVQDVFPQTAKLLAPGNADVSFRIPKTETNDAQLMSFVSVDALPSAWRVANGERGVHFLLGTSLPLSRVLEKSSELLLNALRSVVIASLVAALLAFVVARAVAASLRQIKTAMVHFGKPGAADLPTARQDEIGDLARHFAAMQQQIHAQLLTLEVQRETLDHEAQHDWLTGLANRRALTAFLPQAVARVGRQDSELTVFYLDLDGFKPINDNYGHCIGDLMLVEIAQRLVRCVRAGDFVARAGGDEFVVVCEGLHAGEETTSVADKLIRLIGEPVELSNASAAGQGEARDANGAGVPSLRVGVSIGIASFPKDGRDASTLTTAADQAMYAAKSAGRDVWRLAESNTPTDPQEPPSAT